jgi:hypothetical protein
MAEVNITPTPPTLPPPGLAPVSESRRRAAGNRRSERGVAEVPWFPTPLGSEAASPVDPLSLGVAGERATPLRSIRLSILFEAIAANCPSQGGGQTDRSVSNCFPKA